MQNEIEGLSQSIAEKLPPMMVRTLRPVNIILWKLVIHCLKVPINFMCITIRCKSNMIHFTYRLPRQGWRIALTVQTLSSVVISHSTTWLMRLDKFEALDKCSQTNGKCQSKWPHFITTILSVTWLKCYLLYTGRHWVHCRGPYNVLIMILQWRLTHYNWITSAWRWAS